MSKCQEEQIKLFANYLNTIGAGMVVTGILAPFGALVTNPTLSSDKVIYFALVCFGVSLVLHGVGQAVLGRLPHDVA